MITQEIVKTVKQVLEGMGLDSQEVRLERPVAEAHGDWSSNVALARAGVAGKNPRELGEAIADRLREMIELNKELKDKVEKVEVAGPGFVNFYLRDEYYLRQIRNDVEDGKLELEGELAGKKVVVEFTDPNPFKEFHIGHLYSNIVGESLSRLAETVGAQVRRVCYQGDVGMHVAKSLWGLKEKMKEDKLSLEDLELRVLTERVEYLGQAYALGANAYKENEHAKGQMGEINALVYVVAQRRLVEEEGWEAQVDYSKMVEIDEERLAEVEKLYRAGRAWSLEYFESIYQRLGTKFEGYYFESAVGEYGYKLVQEGLAQGVFEKGEGGAIIYPGEKKGLHNRVFVNAKGLPTYEAKDLGLAPKKYEDWKYDSSIIVTGNEIDDYFKVVLSAMGEVESELREKTRHVSHGMVRLPEGKMSSRTGKVLRGVWLLDEAKRKVEEVIAEKGTDLGGDKDRVAEMLAQGAVKYALLKSNVGGDVVFNFEESVAFEGNSGPYVQYTYARARSVMRKAGEVGKVVEWQSQTGGEGVDRLIEGKELNEEERAVLRQLVRFEEVIEKAAEELAPHMVAGYVYELAGRFNTFYNKHSILSETEDKTGLRLRLTEAMAERLKVGLKLLGIEAPERM